MDSGIRALLATTYFRRLLAVRVVGQFQDGIIQAAFAGFVLFSPESQESTAAVIGAFAMLLLPYSAIGPFIGVFLDRWRRRQVLLWANLFRAGLVLVLAVATVMHASVLVLGALVLVVLGLNRLILTALATSLPRTVPTRLLVSANSVAPVAGTTAAAIAGAATVTVAAWLSATSSTTAILLVIAAGGLLGTALLSLRLPVDLLGPDHRGQRETFGLILSQLAHGAVTLVRTTPTWWAVLGVLSHRVAYGIAVLLAIMASKQVLADNSNSAALGLFSLMIAAAGAGAFVGAVVTPGLVRRLKLGVWPVIAMAIGAVVTPLALAQVTVAGFVITGAALGFAGQSVKIATDATIALTIGDDTRGRVFSLFDVGVNVALLSGIAIAGVTLPASGTSTALTLAVALIILISAAFFVASAYTARRYPPTLIPAQAQQ